MKLRRSVLYVPGNKPRALEKSLGLAADCVVYDLEDSVGPGDKRQARENVIRALAREKPRRQERIVRVNGLKSEWCAEDIAAVKSSAADGVLLPKIEAAEDVSAYRQLWGDQVPQQQLWIMAETAAGILNMRQISIADPAIAVIVLGLEDLALETRIRRTPDRNGFLYAMSASVMAARASGLDVIDGVYPAFRDSAGFMAECRQAVMLGFDGKSLIHPCQVDLCNQCFTPDEDETRRAEQLLAVWDQNRCQGRSVVVFDGRMVEHLHVKEARRVLALAAAARSEP
jgi:citrate lyase subunit beta/citryl-CoA lyase